MQAGRELDALVAEKVMGWYWENGELRPAENTSGYENWKVGYGWLPLYSTDIAAAWQVVEKLRRDYLCCLTLKADYHYVWDIEWSIAPKTWDEDVPHTKHSLGYAIESLPLGICRAALKVVE